MARIMISFESNEIEMLRADAAREIRPTRDHARVLILRALGIVDSESKPVFKDAKSTKRTEVCHADIFQTSA